LKTEQFFFLPYLPRHAVRPSKNNYTWCSLVAPLSVQVELGELSKIIQRRDS